MTRLPPSVRRTQGLQTLLEGSRLEFGRWGGGREALRNVSQPMDNGASSGPPRAGWVPVLTGHCVQPTRASGHGRPAWETSA